MDENKENDQETKDDIFYDNYETVVPSDVVTIQPTPTPARKKTVRKVIPFGVKSEDFFAARKRYNIAAQPGMVVPMTDQEGLDEAYAERAKYKNWLNNGKVGKEPIVGMKLAVQLKRGNRAANNVEDALLAILAFEIQKEMADFYEEINALKPSDTSLLKKAYEKEIIDLLDDFTHLVNMTRQLGSKAGLAMQAIKLVANQVYSADAMLRRRAIWKNRSRPLGRRFRPLTAEERKETIVQSASILALINECNDEDMRIEIKNGEKYLFKYVVITYIISTLRVCLFSIIGLSVTILSYVLLVYILYIFDKTIDL